MSGGMLPWLSAALLLGGALFLWTRVRRKHAAPAAPAPLSEDERKKLAAIMEQKG